MLAKRTWVSGWAGAVLLSCTACGSPSNSGGAANAPSDGGTSGGGGTGSLPGSGGTTGNGGTTGSGGVSGGASGGVSATMDGPRWVGRVDASDPSAVKFAWQGAGFVANVAGPAITIKLSTEGSSTVYFQPVIDGAVGERFNVDPGSPVDVTLATGLADTDHRVELYRETEGAYGVSTFLGFTAGTLQPTPVSNGRLIEVVGDSISAGYGNLGVEPHPGWVADPACHWTAENSSWYATYAAVAGRALDAEVSTIARSGWGMSRDLGGGDNVLPNVYENALGTDDPSPWSFEARASVVVINLGTNDWGLGDPGTAYETAYIDFIATIRSHYPDAFIFLTIGSMTGGSQLTEVNTHLANVVAAVSEATGDDKLVTFDLGTQDLGPDGTGPSGCDWHPNAADHERMAGILQAQVESHLGW